MTDKLPDAVMERAESYLDAQSKEAYRCCETCGHRFFNSRDYPKRAYLTAVEREAMPLVEALEGLSKEVQGLMSAHRVVLGYDYGNSNCAAVDARIETARKALAHFRGGAEEGGSE